MRRILCKYRPQRGQDRIPKFHLGTREIGNAVPVKLAQAIASEVTKYFERQNIKGEILLASYFCGAGGLDLGFEMASNQKINFKTAFCTDIESWAEKTINCNRKAWNFHKADIRTLNPKFVEDILGEKPKVIIGGPPCQPFISFPNTVSLPLS